MSSIVMKRGRLIVPAMIWNQTVRFYGQSTGKSRQISGGVVGGQGSGVSVHFSRKEGFLISTLEKKSDSY